MKARCNVERSREVAFGQLSKPSFGRQHGGLPTDVHGQCAALLCAAHELEQEEPMLGEEGLRGQRVLVNPERFGSDGQHLLLSRGFCWRRSPSQQQHGILIKDVRESSLHATKIRGRFEEAFLYWVENDVPQRNGGAQERCHPRSLPQALPLLTRQQLVRVATNHKQRIEKVDEQITPTLKPERYEEDGEQCRHGPQMPCIEMWEADHERHGRSSIEQETGQHLTTFGWKRRVTDFRWGSPTGCHGRNESHCRDKVDEVLPKIRMSWRVCQGEDDAELRAQSGCLLCRSLSCGCRRHRRLFACLGA
mmetsp:Transcript_35739/g.83096  ORF Transcript_35739/g.83096 Transcript_35739/m.83096 type:complete len:306 (-) Transcript_35739:683-1600(-)